MAEHNQTDIESHLKALRSDATDFIFELAIGSFDSGIDAAFNNKLKQVIMAHKREIDRRLSGDDGTPEYFETVVVYGLMASLLMLRLTEYLKSRYPEAEPSTLAEKVTCRFLTAALIQFEEGQDELETRFPYPNVLDDLAKRLWFSFYDVSAADCERDAADILDRMIAAEEEATNAA